MIVEEVTLRAMRFHAIVGILPHEREHPQPLEMDVTVWRVPGEPGVDVLDYRRLHALARSSAEGGVAYLETAAHAIAAAALAEPGVFRARVALRKPHVALPGPLESAEVVADHTAPEAGRAPAGT